MLNPNHAVVVLSGGQDSTTCLFWALAQKWYTTVHAITFDYGQRHAIEITAAENVWALAKQANPDRCGEHHVLKVGNILRSTSPLVSDSHLEQYADPSSLPGGLEKTFVPMRNQLFLTLAANFAVDKRAAKVITGVCEEDYGGYPDCRQVFIDHLTLATRAGLDCDDFDIFTPLMHLTKAETVELAVEVNGYAALAFSHTSYDGAYPPTGMDHATLLREKGFTEAGLPDPLIVRAWSEGLMELPDRPGYQGEELLAASVQVAEILAAIEARPVPN